MKKPRKAVFTPPNQTELDGCESVNLSYMGRTVSLHMIVIVTARAIPAVTMALASAPRHLPLRNNYCGHLPSG